MKLAFNEKLLAGTVENGVIYNVETDDCEARVNGKCILCHPLQVVCERALRRAGVDLTPEPEPAPVAPCAAQVAPVAIVKPSGKPCPHFRAVKRCFAIFQEKGLPLDDEGMRAVLAELLGREVPSRRTLSGSDWMNAGTLAKQLQVVG